MRDKVSLRAWGSAPLNTAGPNTKEIKTRLTETPRMGRDGGPSPAEGWGRASQQCPVLGEEELGDLHIPRNEGSWGVSKGPLSPLAPKVPGLAQADTFQFRCHDGHGSQNLDSGTVPTPSCSPNIGPGSHHASMGTGPCGCVRPLGDPGLHAHRDAPCLQPGCPGYFAP